MKFLFDENLSPKLVVRLHDLFPESIHVRDVGLQAADDSAIWQFAQNNSLIVCSKDSDMHQRSFLLGFPPKVVWIRLGNCSTSDIERLLRYRHAELSNIRGRRIRIILESLVSPPFFFSSAPLRFFFGWLS
jgi:predicted nuclease of predicted toxin-antitoxin system